jgi:ribosomal protein L28
MQGPNNVSNPYVSKFKNRPPRVWKPNIKTGVMWSEALERKIRLRFVASALRTMDKVGGLDGYVADSTRAQMKKLGPRSWELRAHVINALREKESRNSIVNGRIFDPTFAIPNHTLCYPRKIVPMHLKCSWRNCDPVYGRLFPPAITPTNQIRFQLETVVASSQQQRRMR